MTPAGPASPHRAGGCGRAPGGARPRGPAATRTPRPSRSAAPRAARRLTPVLLLQVAHTQLVLRLHLRAVSPARPHHRARPAPGPQRLAESRACQGARPSAAPRHPPRTAGPQGAQRPRRRRRRHVLCLRRAPRPRRTQARRRPRPGHALSPLGHAPHCATLPSRPAAWPRPSSSPPPGHAPSASPRPGHAPARGPRSCVHFPCAPGTRNAASSFVSTRGETEAPGSSLWDALGGFIFLLVLPRGNRVLVFPGLCILDLVFFTKDC